MIFRVLFQQTNKQTNNHTNGLLVSPGGFRAESKTVLGKAQAPRVEACQGFYCLGFIQPKKQTNKVLGKAQNPRVEAFQGFEYPGFIQPNKQTKKHGREPGELRGWRT